jgi:hypothetical protein
MKTRTSNLLRAGFVVLGVVILTTLSGCTDLIGSDDQATPAPTSDPDTSGPTGTAVTLRATSALEVPAVAESIGISEVIDGPIICEDGGYILSGAPEYLDLTITGVHLQTEPPASEDDWGSWHEAWSGTHTFRVSGGEVDLSAISDEMAPVPGERIHAVMIDFANEARIKGTLTGCVSVADEQAEWGRRYETITVATNPDYVYDAVARTGGADSYAAFTSAAAQEMTVYIGNSAEWPNSFFFETDVDLTAAEGPLTLTLFFDLNRVLRFFNGEKFAIDAPDPAAPEYEEGGDWDHGVNPGDPSDRAYFFAHSFMPIAAFVGVEGRIEGYQSIYRGPEDQMWTVRGWMSLVFDSAGELITGMLIGDDDNDFTVAKGAIQTFDASPTGTGRQIFYDLDDGDNRFYVDGFVSQTDLGSSTGELDFWSEHEDPSRDPHTGTAEFILRFLR